MKILYIAAEHVSGTLSLFKREHERRGDECRYITFWHSQWDFPDDICLNLGGMPNRKWVRSLRKKMSHDPYEKPSRIVNEELPVWDPNPLTKAMFALRDEYNWRKIRTAIETYDLLNFDVVHLDGGLDFTRDSRFARAFKHRGKPVIAYYHGSDLRSRGYIPSVDEISDVRFTPEWDLAVLDRRLTYQYLPIDLSQFEYRPFQASKQLIIGHAARNPLKGTQHVIEAVNQLKDRHSIELRLIKNMSYADALAAKRGCDIFIDQLTNEGGWGYGMSGVEALAMGIPVVTSIVPEMKPLIGTHPFVEASAKNLPEVLESLIQSPDRCAHISSIGRDWVEERHGLVSIMDDVYRHYAKLRLPV